jgi:hypothetical protein
MAEPILVVLGLHEMAHFVELVVIKFEDLAEIYYLLCVVFGENHNCPYFVNRRPGLDLGVPPAVSAA